MQTIKAITGNDMSEGGIRLSVTVVATMNTLYTPEAMKDQARADIIRRVVVVPTKKTRNTDHVDQVLHQDQIKILHATSESKCSSTHHVPCKSVRHIAGGRVQ